MNKGKFALGAVVGGLIGTAIGYLTAPKSGKETRADLKAKADEVKGEAIDKADHVSQEVSKRAKVARDKAEVVADDLKVKADKTSKDARGAIDDAKEKAEEYKNRSENALHGAVDGAKRGFNKK